MMYELYFEVTDRDDYDMEIMMEHGNYIFDNLDNALNGLNKIYSMMKKTTNKYYNEEQNDWDGHSAEKSFKNTMFVKYKVGVREIAIMDNTFLAEY